VCTVQNSSVANTVAQTTVPDLDFHSDSAILCHFVDLDPSRTRLHS